MYEMKKMIRVLMAALLIATMIPIMAFADASNMKPIADETEAVNFIAETLEAGLELYAAEAEEIKMVSIGNGSVTKQLLYAFSGTINSVGSIWDAIVGNSVASDTIFFGTKAEQISDYGDVVRAVAVKSSAGTYLRNAGKYIGVSGEYSSEGTYSDHNVEYSFTAYSYI